MQAALVLGLACTACLVFVVPRCQGGTLQVLGGYVDVHDVNRIVFKKKIHTWGSTEVPAAGGVYVLDAARGYCHPDGPTGGRHYCFGKILVANDTAAGRSHYQIVGSKTFIATDASMTNALETEGWGIQDKSAQTGLQDFVVAEGEMYSGKIRNWAYGKAHFIVKQTTEASLTNAFSTEARNVGSEYWREHYNVDFSIAHDSVMHWVTRFRGWSRTWGSTYTVIYWRIYVLVPILYLC